MGVKVNKETQRKKDLAEFVLNLVGCSTIKQDVKVLRQNFRKMFSKIKEKLEKDKA